MRRMPTSALCVRTRSFSTEETVPPSDAKAEAGSASASRTAEVMRVILPTILAGLFSGGQGRSERTYDTTAQVSSFVMRDLNAGISELLRPFQILLKTKSSGLRDSVRLAGRFLR